MYRVVAVNMTEKAVELISLSKKKKSLTEELAELDSAMEELEKELYWDFAKEKLDELTVKGYILKPVLKFSASAKDEKTIRVMRRRGFGELVKPTIHPSTAHAFIRKQTEENGGSLPGWIADNFKITEKETISLRKE
jgi:hypothetical protein